MRQIGTIPEEQAARTFADYLLTRDITTRLLPSSDGWEVWVHKEDLVPRAKEELDAFLARPGEARYREANREAQALRREAERKDRQHARNTVDLRGRLGAGGLPCTLGAAVRPVLSVQRQAGGDQVFVLQVLKPSRA